MTYYILVFISAAHHFKHCLSGHTRPAEAVASYRCLMPPRLLFPLLKEDFGLATLFRISWKLADIFIELFISARRYRRQHWMTGRWRCYACVRRLTPPASFISPVSLFTFISGISRRGEVIHIRADTLLSFDIFALKPMITLFHQVTSAASARFLSGQSIDLFLKDHF